MRALIITIVTLFAATPTFAHHEVVVATTALPSMIWFAVVASGAAAAFWRNWRRK
ncbi:hypothetical protein BC777_2698 [Yoonia maricola]|uniref:Secreted protein with PEP-CTERM sorting signal n=1 Tax=Yoonia maricola TaxID=420999 RepID=A0A2M8W5Z2_9RHOB|nr:hypothetical protein [Yoonia maricola]PJI86330.1 hypothetical protein BC777_2698 [Yoonia maricola]